MSDIVTVKIKGLDELQKTLQVQLPKDAKLALRIALSAGAGDVKRAMEDDAPVESDGGADSGFLKKNIRTKVTLRRNDLAGTAKIGPTNAVYPGRGGKRGSVSFKTKTGRVINFISNHAGAVTAAAVGRFLEFGTRKMAAHPWMTKAWEASKEKAFNHIIAKLKETLKLS